MKQTRVEDLPKPDDGEARISKWSIGDDRNDGTYYSIYIKSGKSDLFRPRISIGSKVGTMDSDSRNRHGVQRQKVVDGEDGGACKDGGSNVLNCGPQSQLRRPQSAVAVC